VDAVTISLFVPYFRPENAARREELEACLAENIACKQVDHIFLMIDDDASVDEGNDKLTSIKMNDRPTYGDWVRLSNKYCGDGISVLANADIYLDASISKLDSLFGRDPQAFVALSRYDIVDGSRRLHSNPHWSQDVWAFCPGVAKNTARDNCLNFPLGVPRCDNKAAYVFGLYGHTIYNPCYDIQSIHLHDSEERTYDKKADKRILGGVAMVYASENLFTASKLDIEVWPSNTKQFCDLKLNRSIEKWDREREQKLNIKGQTQTKKLPSLVSLDSNVYFFDDHWQFPAITEKHACSQMRLLAPKRANVVYIGFPWATLIDLNNHNKADKPRLSDLNHALEFLSSRAQAFESVVTVCQHIHMLKFPELFKGAGVTDVFWSHSVKGSNKFSTSTDINLHAFPLYPVQGAVGSRIPFAVREHLFSFVGAKANSIYLTQARNIIIEELSGHPKGCVIERSTWHYNKIVYEGQVLARTKVSNNLIDKAASDEFSAVMGNSKFALCPSGTGPNSIRLWEALMNGAIPVVLADTYRFPGDPDLWSRAVVMCNEDRDSIRALPARLEEIEADAGKIRRMHLAGELLVSRYGSSNFVNDILEFFDDSESAVGA
jgi:hypothetical protein